MFLRLEKRDIIKILQQMRVGIIEIVFMNEEIINELRHTQNELVIFALFAVK
jgi:hypothetical protein